MSELQDGPSKALINALRESDDLRRDSRLKRLAWVSLVPRPEGLVSGPIDTMQMIEESRACFTDGHFVAVVLLACSVIEHLVSDALKERKVSGGSLTFAHAINVARSHSLFRGDLLDRADELRAKRNPFTHRKSPEHQQSFPHDTWQMDDIRTRFLRTTRNSRWYLCMGSSMPQSARANLEFNRTACAAWASRGCAGSLPAQAAQAAGQRRR